MGKSGLCLSGVASSITELARTMGLELFERAIVPVSSHLRLWGVTPTLVLELGASKVWHYLYAGKYELNDFGMGL